MGIFFMKIPSEWLTDRGQFQTAYTLTRTGFIETGYTHLLILICFVSYNNATHFYQYLHHWWGLIQHYLHFRQFLLHSTIIWPNLQQDFHWPWRYSTSRLFHYFLYFGFTVIIATDINLINIRVFYHVNKIRNVLMDLQTELSFHFC